MKLVFVLTCFLASTAASVISGWEQLKSPLFNPRYESILSEIYSQVNGDQGSSRTPRIVGGKDAARNQFPFQTYLYFDRVSSCGGSIISPNFILTAGHCTYRTDFVDIFVGSIDRTNSAPWRRVLSSEFFLNQLYNDNTLVNDIALIRTPAIPINNVNIGVVSLPSRAEAAINSACETFTISGFGMTSDTSDLFSDTLKYVEVLLDNNKKCSCIYQSYFVPRTNICVDGSGGRGSCVGDSGGPGTIVLNNKTVQVGVVSFGSIVGCETGIPNVFTRVGSYLDWIEKITGIVIN